MSEVTAAAKAAELHTQLQAKIASLVEGNDWRAFLSTSARFHSYSAANVMLILAQRETATRVAGFKAWQGMGRHVLKGERGIKILAPSRYKVTDENTGETRSVLRGFSVAHVWDISQTGGEPLADCAPELLTGAGQVGLYEQLARQVSAAGFRVERGDCDGANGWTDHARRIVRVRDDVDPAQAAKTLAHELAHVLRHSPEQVTYRSNRPLCEVEAESIAFIVCAASGLVTDDYSLPYVARWSGGDPTIVKATADRVVKTAQSVLAALAAAVPAEALAA